MPSPSFNLETRINALNAVLNKKAEQQVVSDALTASNGNWEAAMTTLTAQLPDTSLQKVAFANTLAAWSNDNIPVIQNLVGQPGLSNLRDVALNFNVEKLAALVDPQVVPQNITGATNDKKNGMLLLFYNTSCLLSNQVSLGRGADLANSGLVS